MAHLIVGIPVNAQKNALKESGRDELVFSWHPISLIYESIEPLFNHVPEKSDQVVALDQNTSRCVSTLASLEDKLTTYPYSLRKKKKKKKNGFPCLFHDVCCWLCLDMGSTDSQYNSCLSNELHPIQQSPFSLKCNLCINYIEAECETNKSHEKLMDEYKAFLPQGSHILLLLAVPATLTPHLLLKLLNLSQRSDRTYLNDLQVECIRIFYNVPVTSGPSFPDEKPSLEVYSVAFFFTSQREATEFYWMYHGAYFEALYNQYCVKKPDKAEPELHNLDVCCYFINVLSITYKLFESKASLCKLIQEPSTKISVYPKNYSIKTILFMSYCPVCLERVDLSVFGVLTRFGTWTRYAPENKSYIRSCIVCYTLYTCFSLLKLRLNSKDTACFKENNSPSVCTYPKNLILHINAASHSIFLSNESSSSVYNRSSLNGLIKKDWSMGKNSCAECNDLNEAWICLICGHRGCGRYKLKHAQQHAMASKHPVCMQVSTGHIWDYRHEVFVHRCIMYPSLSLHSEFSRMIKLSTSVQSSPPSTLSALFKPIPSLDSFSCRESSLETLCPISRQEAFDLKGIVIDSSSLATESVSNSLWKFTERKSSCASRIESHDAFPTEFKLYLQSQLEFQRNFFWKKLCNIDHEAWNQLKSRLEDCDALQLRISLYKQDASELAASVKKQHKANLTLSKRNKCLLQQMAELKQLNESFLKKLCHISNSSRTLPLSQSSLDTTQLHESLQARIKALETKLEDLYSSF